MIFGTKFVVTADGKTVSRIYASNIPTDGSAKPTLIKYNNSVVRDVKVVRLSPEGFYNVYDSTVTVGVGFNKTYGEVDMSIKIVNDTTNGNTYWWNACNISKWQ